MSFEYDVEFEVRIGLFSRVGQLTNLQLVNQYKQADLEIERAARDRRLKQKTREQRIADSDAIRRACFSELSARIERQAVKLFFERVRKTDEPHEHPSVVIRHPRWRGMVAIAQRQSDDHP